MRLTDELVEQDNDRWGHVNLLAELEYCGREIKHRKSITNEDIRFHAALMRFAKKQLTPEPIPVDKKIIGLPEGDKEVWCCRDCRMVLDPNFTYCPHCGALLSWDNFLD